MQGMRPVVEVMYEDFLTLAAEQVINQAAKHRYMSGGQLKVPLTIRTQGGAGWSPGAQHAQQLEGWFVHIPGLKVVFASTPTDVRGLLYSSIYEDNPVLFFEHRTLYGSKEEVPDDLEPIPLGQARVQREGEDVTVVATGRLVHEALAAAEEAEKEGVSVEVVDPRTLQPLDEGSSSAPSRRRTAASSPTRPSRVWASVPRLRLSSSTRRSTGSTPDRARRRQVHAAAVRAGDGGVGGSARRGRPAGGQEDRDRKRWRLRSSSPARPGHGVRHGRPLAEAGGRSRREGRPLYELDTEKVTQEVEADASGVLLKIAVREGEVPVGQTIAVIGEEGEEVSVQPESTNGDSGQEEGSRAPARAKSASGRQASADEPEPSMSEQITGVEPSRADGRIKASPLARRIAREKGMDLSQVRRTGPDGSSPRTSSVPSPGQPAAVHRHAGRAGSRGADVDRKDDRAPADQGVGGPVDSSWSRPI